MKCPHCNKEIEMPETESEDANEVEVSIEGSPDSIRMTLEKLMPGKKK